MFKKASVLTKHALSKQDVKRLKKDVRLAMPALSEEDVDLLVPSKAEVVLSKLSNRALVYAVEGCNPILFDPVRPGRLSDEQAAHYSRAGAAGGPWSRRAFSSRRHSRRHR